MCWKESPSRCPTESSLSPDYAHNPRGLQRKGTTRSQESGYESSINSPVSPLMGPETLEQSGMGPYPGAPYSNEDMSLTLELHTIHSGASPSQAPTHQVPPVPTPRNRQEYHGNDATHVWGVWVLWLLTHHTMPSILDVDYNCTYSAFLWLNDSLVQYFSFWLWMVDPFKFGMDELTNSLCLVWHIHLNPPPILYSHYTFSTLEPVFCTR